jgi:peptidyl-prolyl cis-trans isomerase SurA
MRYFCTTFVAVLLTTCLPVKAQTNLADGIELIVDKAIITYYQIDVSMLPALREAQRQYGDQPEVFRQKLTEIRNDDREILLENELILHEYETGGYNLPESIIDEQLQSYIRNKYGDDRVRFIRTLQQDGKTFEQFRKEFREHLIIQQMRYSHSSGQVIVSPHKIEAYYSQHKDDFKVNGEVKLRMIVLNKPADDTGQTHRLAQDILTKINEGAAFADMAKVYSQDSKRSQGGEWSWFETDKLRKELADVADHLKPGERSGVIDTPEACYLMLIEDKRPEHIRPLNEVRDQIDDVLLAQERDRLQRQWIDKLKKKTFIRYVADAAGS